jgi:hypothetical protein
MYSSDFLAWTRQQAELLRSKQFSDLDIDNLIEELESLGRQERRELTNRLTVLLMHLLKCQYQPEKLSKSWIATIKVQRKEINKLIEQNPSLKPYIPEAIESAFEQARIDAGEETGIDLDVFPEICPYSWEEIQHKQC